MMIGLMIAGWGITGVLAVLVFARMLRRTGGADGSESVDEGATAPVARRFADG